MSRIRIAMRYVLSGLVAATLAAATIGTAAAQPYPYHRPPPRHHHRPPPPPAWGYDRPTYVPAPPPVVYAPEGPPAAINFGLSFNLH